ncbi:MAG: SH3 domain-containing protein, partial [Chloroflexota bacterium]
VYGTASNPRALLLSAATAPAEDTGFVRFVHGIVGGPAVDVFINDTLIVPAFTPETPTEHIALPEGEHEVVFVDAENDDELGDIEIEVEAGAAQTIAAYLEDGDIEINDFEDDISDVDETTAVATVLNTIDGATVTVESADGTTFADEIEVGDASDATAIDPIVSELSFTLELGDDEATLNAGNTVFYGGTYYNIIVLDGSSFGAPSLFVIPTALARTLDSAPGAGDVTLATTTTTDTSETTDTGDTSAEEETVAEEATAAPTQPVALPPPTEAPPEVITGEVALDPSANLNLRQFPSSDALVLAQAPSGASLIINGREGIPVALVEGQDPPPEAEDFVDPVTLLEDENADLDPSETWVNVTYNTPDGGSVIAWTLSQFLIITDDEGFVRLRDLETVAGNIPGETLNTDVTPPSEQEDLVTATVININSDANLNVRRNPDAASEVLAQLPLGTRVELLGLLPVESVLADAEWAFISYAPDSGGVITGWVSTGFINYQLNGENESLEDLILLNLIEESTEDAIGQVTAGAAPVSVATPDPQVDAYVAEVILDADANLNLRRTPNVDSEVIVQIPSGTFLIVEARTADAEWLQVTFEGEVGWISSQFVSVTFNGAFIEDITEIPVDETIGN